MFRADQAVDCNNIAKNPVDALGPHTYMAAPAADAASLRGFAFVSRLL